MACGMRALIIAFDVEQMAGQEKPLRISRLQS